MLNPSILHRPGALSALNIRATVTVESKELPVCIFTIKFEGKN